MPTDPPMRDLDIRRALHVALRDEFGGDPSTMFVDEMGLCRGEARVDVAVVNGRLHGYEIKSDRDTLDRLPRQEEVYSRVFDYVTIVIGSKHAESVQRAVPEWWGINIAETVCGCVHLSVARPARRNDTPDAVSIAELLWKDEALEILEQIGCARGVRSKPRATICSRLVDSLPLVELQRLVREKIKARAAWRSDL